MVTLSVIFDYSATLSCTHVWLCRNRAQTCAGNTEFPRCSMAYAAPELLQAYKEHRNICVDGSTDIWSLGVLAYEAVSGSGAQRFSGTDEAIERAYGRGSFPWETPEGMTEQFARSRARHVVLSCLRREPARRPTAAQLLQAIDRLNNATLDGPGGNCAPMGMSSLMRAG